MMNKSSLLEMRGTGHEVVVLYYECLGTKQMQ